MRFNDIWYYKEGGGGLMFIIILRNKKDNIIFELGFMKKEISGN